MTASTQPTNLKLAAFTLALMALVFRALVPMGYMPGTDGGMVICSGMDGAAVTVAAAFDPKNPESPAPHKTGKEFCGFSVNTGNTGPVAAMPVPLPLPSQAAFAIIRAALVTAAPRNHHAARAPPLA